MSVRDQWIKFEEKEKPDCYTLVNSMTIAEMIEWFEKRLKEKKEENDSIWGGIW